MTIDLIVNCYERTYRQVRNAEHPFTFEARVEAYQRAAGRPRASHAGVAYSTNDLAPVVQRIGGYSRGEAVRLRTLRRMESALSGRFQTPRLRLP